MKCNVCNYENPEASVFCNKCGTRLMEKSMEEKSGLECSQQQPQKSWRIKLSKKKLIVGGTCCVALGAILLGAGIVLNAGYSRQVVKYLEQGESGKAQEIYAAKIKENPKQREKLLELITKQEQAIKEQYAEESMSYEEAEKSLKLLYRLELVPATQKDESFSYLDKLKESKAQFARGNDLLQTDKGEAITCFKKVIEIDSNYEKAQNLIEETKVSYSVQVIEEVKQLASEEKYKQALEKIEKASTILGINEELKTLEDTYKVSINKQLLGEVDELIQDKKYIEAIALIDGNLAYDLDGSMATKRNELESLKEGAVKEELQEIKTRLTVTYDDVAKKYTIVPKGYSTKYNNISATTNIELRLAVDDRPILMMITGFVNSDWIFMERITFACDDFREEVELEYFDRGSKVIWGGGVAEWYIFAHNDSEIQTSQIRNLEEIITQIIASDKATIRFSGESYVDHLITAKEKQTIQDIWEVYTILNEYPSMIDLLK